MELQRLLDGRNRAQIARIAGVSHECVVRAGKGKNIVEPYASWIAEACKIVETQPMRGLSEREVERLEALRLGRAGRRSRTRSGRPAMQAPPLPPATPSVTDARLLAVLRPMVKRYLLDKSKGTVDQWRLLSKIIRDTHGQVESKLVHLVGPMVRRWEDDGYKGHVDRWAALVRTVRTL